MRKKNPKKRQQQQQHQQQILLRMQTFVDVGGILSETIVITTDNDNKIVRAKPFFSPLSTGRIKTNGAIVARTITGSSMFNR
jgi:hypothetical protein